MSSSIIHQTGDETWEPQNSLAYSAVVILTLFTCIAGLFYVLSLILFIWTAIKKRSIIKQLHYRYIVNGASSTIAPCMLFICFLKLMGVGMFLALISVSNMENEQNIQGTSTDRIVILFLSFIPKYLTPFALILLLAILVNELVWDGTLDGAFDHVVNLKKYLIVGRVLLGIILVLMGLICCLALMSQAVTMAYLTSDIPTFISWMSNTYRTIIASYIMWFLSNGVLMGLGFAVFLLIKKTAADIQRAPLNPEMLRLSANYLLMLIAIVGVINVIMIAIQAGGTSLEYSSDPNQRYKYVFTDIASDFVLWISSIIIFVIIGPKNDLQGAPSHAPRNQEPKIEQTENVLNLEKYAQMNDMNDEHDN